MNKKTEMQGKPCRGKKPDLIKRKMDNRKIQTIKVKIKVKVPERAYKSGVVIPEHQFTRMREKQIVHPRIAVDHQTEKKFSYVGRLKPLYGGMYK